MHSVTIGTVTIILGDSFKIMANMDRVDHMIMDPPYDAEAHKQYRPRRNKEGGARQRKQLDFDVMNDKMMSDMCMYARQLCNGWMVAFCQTEQVSFWRDDIESARLKYKSPMIWVKPDATPKMNGQGPAIGYESMVTAWCGSGYSKWNGGGKRGVYEHLTNSKTRGDYNVKDKDGKPIKHPTEKPLLLMRELITDFTEHEQLILDPFAGSGTTGVAALQLGRRCILIENQQHYFDICCERVQAASREADFFVPHVKMKQTSMELPDGAIVGLKRKTKDKTPLVA